MRQLGAGAAGMLSTSAGATSQEGERSTGG